MAEPISPLDYSQQLSGVSIVRLVLAKVVDQRLPLLAKLTAIDFRMNERSIIAWATT